MVSSMMGFSYKQTVIEDIEFLLEFKTYNSRFLDINIRVPDHYRLFETVVYSSIKRVLKRGRVDFSLSLSSKSLKEGISFSSLKKIKKIHTDCSKFFPIQTLSLHEILGYIEFESSSEKHLVPTRDFDQLEKVLSLSLDELLFSRRVEGKKIKHVLENSVHNICCIQEKIKKIFLGFQEEQFREKIERSLSQVLDSREYGNNSVVLQEMLTMILKADIHEELDRIEFHTTEILSTLNVNSDSSIPVGKKLEFLIQELHREVNTMASKTHINDIARYAIDLKLILESMREQVQNLE